MPKLPVSYQVWVLGYNDDDCITDFDEFLGEFSSGLEATEYAESLSLSDVKNKLEKLGAEIPEDVRYLHLQVETVKKHKDWEENVDTIYEDTFDLGGRIKMTKDQIEAIIALHKNAVNGAKEAYKEAENNCRENTFMDSGEADSYIKYVEGIEAVMEILDIPFPDWDIDGDEDEEKEEE